MKWTLSIVLKYTTAEKTSDMAYSLYKVRINATFKLHQIELLNLIVNPFSMNLQNADFLKFQFFEVGWPGLESVYYNIVT